MKKTIKESMATLEEFLTEFEVLRPVFEDESFTTSFTLTDISVSVLINEANSNVVDLIKSVFTIAPTYSEVIPYDFFTYQMSFNGIVIRINTLHKI